MRTTKVRHPKAGNTTTSNLAGLTIGHRIAALAVTGLVALTLSVSTAMAAPTNDDEPPSTPINTAPAEGELMSYAVNLKQVGKAQTKRAERMIESAGGTVVQSWPQIGVVIAHSTKARFLQNLDRINGSGGPVESSGQTRTAPVKEGTPTDKQKALNSEAQGNAESGQKTKTKTQKRVGNYDAGADVSEGQLVEDDPLEATQWGNRAVKADKAQKITGGDPDVLVGIVDTGVQGDHPDLAPNFSADKSVSCQNAGVPQRTNWGPSTSGHGTHVAGTVAAAKNGQGIVGVAPQTTIASIKTSSDDGLFYPEYVVCGMVWAADQGFDVTNHSYFVDPWQYWCNDQRNQIAGREAVRRAFAYATGKGVVSSVAAGNQDADLANKKFDTASPNDTEPKQRRVNNNCADLPQEVGGVVAVSALETNADESNYTRAYFSNYGKNKISVTAPGRGIVSTYPDDSYAQLSGTSMAAPHAAGVLALLKANNPQASPQELIDMLQSQAEEKACDDERCTGKPSYNSYYGNGLVDALKAVGN